MRRIALLLALAAAAVAALPAGATTERDRLIRPGVGIAKVRLGMTQAQLRAVMGRPLAVLPQQAQFGRAAVEWQYGYGAYTVRLEGRRNALRVVRVATTVLKERTREGFGVGTLESRLERVFGGRLRCERLETGTIGGSAHTIFVLSKNRDCVLTHSNGTRTVFVTWVKPVETYDGLATPERWEKEAQVLAIEVRAA
jgi:hypothetical protein